jgi:nucleoside-diphosphate-sugar epimerase
MYWAINKQALPITGDGTETRDWTYVEDIVFGLLAMGIEEKAIGEAFNLGSGEEHRVIDMANLVNRITGNNAGIKFVSKRDWDVKTRLLSSINKAKELLGYKPEVSFEDGVKELHNWFGQNQNDIWKSAEF